MADAGPPCDPAEAGPRIGGESDLRPMDESRAARRLADLGAIAAAEGCARLARFAVAGPEAERRRLAAVLDLSPHLEAGMLRHPRWIEALFTGDAAGRIAAILSGLKGLPERGTSEARLMTLLREAKQEASLMIALRDLFGAADPRRTTADLSQLAEAALGAALRFALLDLHGRGKLALPDPEAPETGCGLFVLGMGKLGGGELNYSSDIDLVVLFDPDCPAIVDPEEGVELFSRLVRRLIRLIGERSADGYVFRTDLRLRPDPGAMPLAIPVSAALAYYEGSGRNWERAAMIKARVVAGDRRAAAAFLAEITPFVWRKYLDFAAIAEIQSMKNRIDRHRGFEGLGVAGHDVKLGPGGIREAEFFAQAQQLIAGGRAPALRQRRTEEALAALAQGGWISAAVAAELIEAYWFLRRVEHAVQMIADEQSHVLPRDAEGLLRVARLLAFPDTETFGAALTQRLSTVERHFSGLFAACEAVPRSGVGAKGEREAAALGVLLARENEADLLAHLAALGFARPADVARMLRAWNAGRYRATRSEAARRQLARVLPSLLDAFAGARDGDAALAAFDRFVAGLPSGLQFFSILANNPRILGLLALVLTAAPRLAETIARRPHVFDALLDPAFLAEATTRELLAARLAPFLAEATGYEDRLVRLRLFASEQRFLVGARLLGATIGGMEAGGAFSAIADVAIEAAFAAVEAAFAERHGRVPGGRTALFGLGRLGSGELTANSDVDLILFYDHAPDAESSDGERPLAPSLYYARLTQRLIAALSAPMGEGLLYDVDFRLRPSGNKGPLATHIDAFRRYQRTEARTWERMALTRSRRVAGDGDLSRTVAAAIRDAIAAPREAGSIGGDVAAMRALLEREKPPRGPLDLKLRPGGLIDLEFLAQWAILAGRAAPALIGRPTADILAVLDASPDLPNRNFGVTLRSSAAAYTGILQLTRLGPGGVHRTDQLPDGLAECVARAIGVDAPSGIEPFVNETTAFVRETFERLLSRTPAQPS